MSDAFTDDGQLKPLTITLENESTLTFPVEPEPNLLAQVSQPHSPFPRGALRLKTKEKLTQAIEKQTLGIAKTQCVGSKIRQTHGLAILLGRRLLANIEEEGQTTPTSIVCEIEEEIPGKIHSDKRLALYYQVGKQLLEASLTSLARETE